MKNKMALIIADPWDTLDHDNDSSIYLAEYAQNQLQIDCFWATPSKIYVKKNIPYVECVGSTKTTKKLLDFGTIHWRVDPPVDLETYRLWSLLCQLDFKSTKFINPPEALLKWNEKFSTLKFLGDSIPTSIANKPSLLTRANKLTVLKPSADAASRGLKIISPKDSPTKFNAFFNKIKKEAGPWVIAQPVMNQILKSGEVRAFYINGKIVSSLKKTSDQIIMNMDAPKSRKPKLVSYYLNENEKRVTKKVSHLLKKDGIHLASIDLINGKLLEINVTSVGLIKHHDLNCSKEANLLAKAYWKALQ